MSAKRVHGVGLVVRQRVAAFRPHQTTIHAGLDHSSETTEFGFVW
jgi:hypothetical protein